MTMLKQRLIMMLTLSFLVVAAAQSEQSALIATAVAAVAFAAILAARHATLAAVGIHELTVGGRAREHRNVLSSMPSPQHPDTAGRPRSRAPARPSSAA
ncbi:DUF6412 domain-containing protein [Homoserinimonas aerilata]|nr:DUF6412 domain-containing protein [Homoserinimonas aerilata]